MQFVFVGGVGVMPIDYIERHSEFRSAQRVR